MIRTFEDLGALVLAEIGMAECLASYDTFDPYWVGFQALGYGDVNRAVAFN